MMSLARNLSVLMLLSLPAVAAPMDVSALAQRALELQRVTGASQRNNVLTVESTDPLQMLQDYIATKNQYSPEVLAKYVYLVSSGQIFEDTAIAGLISSGVAFDAVRGNARAETLVRTLSAEGAIFAFDGFEQNGCASPTPYLLVIDVQAQKVYGIDLNPCKGE
jgi:hypothetical protein